MNVNMVILAGHLTRDPQLSYTAAQLPVVDFGMAINERWVGKDGVKQERVCYVDFNAFGKRAETIDKYCKKGDPFFVRGKLTFDSWQAQDGSNRSKLRVTVENFEFLGGTEQKQKPEPEPEVETPF